MEVNTYDWANRVKTWTKPASSAVNYSYDQANNLQTERDEEVTKFLTPEQIVQYNQVTQKYQAKAVGVEISEHLVKSTNDTIKRLNLQDQVKVIHGDLLHVNLEPADVVTIYLETGSNDLLRPNLERELKPGSRVVSHDFMVPGWKPSHVETMDAFKRPHTIYVYDMPQKSKK